MSHALDYIDCLEALPEELQRHRTQVRESEAHSFAMTSRVESGLLRFMEQLLTSTLAEREHALQQLSDDLDATVVHAESKAKCWLAAKHTMERYTERVEEDTRRIEQECHESARGRADHRAAVRRDASTPAGRASVDAMLGGSAGPYYYPSANAGSGRMPPYMLGGGAYAPQLHAGNGKYLSANDKKRKNPSSSSSSSYPYGFNGGLHANGYGSSMSHGQDKGKKPPSAKVKKQKTDLWGGAAYGMAGGAAAMMYGSGGRLEEDSPVVLSALRNHVLPIYRGKSPCPPLCGPNPAGPEYVMQKGDLVAARLTKSKDSVEWILATIVKQITNRNRYEVEDVEEDDDGDGVDSRPAGSKRRFTLSGQNIIPLPKSLPDPSKKLEFRKDQAVLALYPGTTCFYQARVVETPSRRPRTFDYLLQFEDDNDEMKEIPQRFVLNMPRAT